jgi:hypothetical protein
VTVCTDVGGPGSSGVLDGVTVITGGGKETASGAMEYRKMPAQ